MHSDSDPCVSRFTVPGLAELIVCEAFKKPAPSGGVVVVVVVKCFDLISCMLAVGPLTALARPGKCPLPLSTYSAIRSLIA